MELRILPKRLSIAFDKTTSINTKTDIDKTLIQSFPNSKSLKSVSKKEKWKPVDDSIGIIKHIAISYPHFNEKDVDSKNAYNKIYTDLVFKLINAGGDIYGSGSFQKMKLMTISPINAKTGSEENIRRYLSCINLSIKTLSGFVSDNQLSESIIIDGLTTNPYKWIQDKILIAKNKTGNKIKLLKAQKYFDEQISADALTKSWPQITNDGTRIQMDTHGYNRMVGGNVLFFSDFVLIGIDNIRSNFESFSTNHEYKELYDFFLKEFGIERYQVIVLESQYYGNIKKPERYDYNWMGTHSHQPLYHLDTFITPVGNDANGYPRLVVGEPINIYNIDTGVFNSVKEGIEKIIKNIREKVSNVIIYRNPIPLIYVDEFDRDDDGTVLETHKRIWNFAFYNNSIVQYEKFNSKKNILWMPTFGKDLSNEFIGSENDMLGGNWKDLKKFDEENERIFSQLGFRVIKLTNYLPLIKERGGPRCMTKILSRYNMGNNLMS